MLNAKKRQHVIELCKQRKVRMTAQRMQVLELIWQKKAAVTAYELLDLLKQTEPHAKPPTVYRALDFLLEQGFIHRVESNNSFISCCSFDEDKHFSHLLICDSCGEVTEIQDKALLDLLNQHLKQQHFHLSSHVIETHGKCHQCCHH
ncbi:MAG: zinc uptake transcriptional repressor Zur [Vibrio sp.]